MVLANALVGLAFLLGVLAAALFGAAGTWHYWQAWAFLATFAAATLAITIFLAVRDPALLARRTKAGPLAEPTHAQQVIQSVASLAFVAVFVVAGLDRRWGWSHVPDALAIAGDALVVVGLAIVGLVFRANTYTSATVQVERQQVVISTGPYGVVRHPMYAGAFVMLLGLPLALASWCSAPALVPLFAAIVVRLFAEERVLLHELAGYADYRGKVRYRLVPRVW
jgi:protein-S-isoprenylcysteine O-methyltransferase Ste14